MKKLCTSLLLLFLGLVSTFALVASDSLPPNEVWALSSFKEAMYDDPFLALSNWNTIDSDPCNWFGVLCTTARDHVIKLNISGSSLKGFLAPELGQITYLQELILCSNELIGIIPKELSMLKSLKVLDLGNNQLSGPIPPELGNLTELVDMNLQSNDLTGRLPPELGNLKYLQELRLDRNKLQGPVPGGDSSNFSSTINGMYATNANLTGFCRWSQLKVADFSYNYLVGSIPDCLHYLPSLYFQGNCLQIQNKDSKQRPSIQCAGASPARSQPLVNPNMYVSKHHGASKPVWLLALEIITGTMIGSLFLIALLAALQRWNKKASIIIPWKKSTSQNDSTTVYIDPEMLKDVRRYTRQELEVACEDFSNIIGSSPDSVVYKGTMKGGPEIAVISLCIKEEHWTGYLELYFQREVADLARLDHENTGKLLGYCRESTPFTRMLVFEYASNGTLHEHLHCYGERCQFSWTRRMKIIIGIARGLKYLHTEIEPPFTISELNSSAVYLTEEFSPKLVDFESWKTILERSEKNSGSIGSQGAICVLPNSVEARHLDTKGNIHAFGVLLLEIISGRLPYCKNKGYLVDWVIKNLTKCYVKKRLVWLSGYAKRVYVMPLQAKDYLEMPEVMSYVVDPELKHFRYDDLKVICEVVSLCINPDTTARPSMRELCGMLESRIDTSTSVELKSSSLAWAELALLS
ncbi:probable LRR receptor-like serine/threonine-protein kinase At1g63430 isoform X1 [Arachis ipaensis]|uniref:probable LRR receptor-like serine/threonine-protein kinase At1g63430 isoform X1 n=1 Tax=Arachis ipaensis TaxID=130454 RepID=UPI000A2B029E|nr:probable LRR receptor-like serine/threonine-protein kinase At1g63430 isoform X1 [Arachis ipaensis]XP_025653752.1 probable LRR receptor-like serine/threonine-protein kinase At1g63430 isoform X2 [Arachis hypogaea]